MSQGRAGPARNDYLLARYLLLIIGVTLLVFALLVIARLGVFYSLYTWLFGEVFAVTGFDLWFSRAITLGLLVVLWYFGGHLVVMTWIGERRKRLAIIIGATALALVAMELATRNVYFSRADGSPAKYYIRTLDGYKFSASPGTDPVHGVPYRPMTAQVAREYLLWKSEAEKSRTRRFQKISTSVQPPVIRCAGTPTYPTARSRCSLCPAFILSTAPSFCR